MFDALVIGFTLQNNTVTSNKGWICLTDSDEDQKKRETRQQGHLLCDLRIRNVVLIVVLYGLSRPLSNGSNK